MRILVNTPTGAVAAAKRAGTKRAVVVSSISAQVPA